MADDRWIIVGLGNPGPEYAGTRHNVGQMVLALLAERMGARFKANRTRNDIAEGRLAGQLATLARPQSYMNLSGGPVSALLGFYKLSPERTVVLHDELDVPFGGVRLKLGGGDNGHNGLRSISTSLGTRDYYRVRFGSAVRRAAWTPRTSCSGTSPPASGRNSRSPSIAAPTPWRP